MISKSLIVALLGAGAAQAAEFSFNTLIRSGQPTDAEYPFGTVVSSNASKVLTNVLGGELYGQWDPEYPNNKSAVAVSNNPDFFSIFDAPDGGMVGFVHFESPNPSGVYALGLKQAKDGTLSVTSTEPVDFSEYGGAWILCAGTNSPWGSHLGGEEYEPDAYKFENAGCLFESQCGEESLQILDEDGFGSTISMLRYFGLYAADNVTTLDEVKKVFNPYDYGYTIEIVPESSTNGKGSKWYTSGRLSQELAYVMPNNQTMYVTDDGTNVGFFRVEMDKPNDMSSTTIYAAKLDQKSAENGGQFDMSWVELGSNTQEALQAAIKGGIQFSDMFTGVAPVNGTCPDGYTSINQGGDGQECLTLVSGQENLAAFLEPRRYAAYLGATTEGSKWEGFVYDPYTKKAYTSISDVRYGMENKQKKGADEPKYDQGGPNAIQLPYNPCGCVFALEFDDNFVATNFNAALCGTPMEEDQFGQTCEVTGVSNPDNLNRIGKTILIGEDTDNHQNDFMWAWDPSTGKLTRLATTPYGSEVTGINVVTDLNGGFNYVTMVVQHPYGETDIEQVDKDTNPYSEGPQGYVGYWAIPSSQDLEKVFFNSVDEPMTQEEKSKVNVASFTNEIKSVAPSSTPSSTPAPSTPSSSASLMASSAAALTLAAVMNL